MKEFLSVTVLLVKNYVVCAALNDTGSGNECETSLLLKLGNGKSTAVAHCGANLCESYSYVVCKSTCVGNVGVNTFLEGKFLVAA